MTADDLPLVKRWLGEPHVTQWWGAPDEQFGLVSGEPALDRFIVNSSERPLGYLQCYDLTEWNTGFGRQPDGTRGIDLFIGETDMIGQGHGSALISAFVDRLFKNGTPRAVSDPDPANARAIRAYEKAGFRRERLVDTPDGRSLLMVRDA